MNTSYLVHKSVFGLKQKEPSSLTLIRVSHKRPPPAEILLVLPDPCREMTGIPQINSSRSSILEAMVTETIGLERIGVLGVQK